MKDSRRCSSTKSLFLHVITHNSLFFLPGFSFTNILDLQDSRLRGRLSLYILSTTSTRSTGIQTLAGLLLQRAHISAQLAPGIKHGTFGTRSLEFTLSTFALVAAVVRRMLKTLVKLGNNFLALLNLVKILIFVMFKDDWVWRKKF